MSTILITGTSGFIGKALAISLSKKHKIIGFSRKNPNIDGIENLQGEFSNLEDLRKLNKFNINNVVHLAAVTGGCSERDGILVNVEGTRQLMRYLIDRGCKKFVMASSIAAVGMQSIEFRPLQVPIADEHPCFDRDGYGFSKFLMEEVTKYYQRQNPDIDVINLRLAAICPDNNPAELVGITPIKQWALGGLSMMMLSDAVKVFSLAVENPYKNGVRIMNATAPLAWSNEPTADILRNWWGDDVDLFYYENPTNKYASAYDTRMIIKELGFIAETTCKYLEKARK
ncbi:MAG TPA: NAD(P)-dependent oxidoreductase [Victivallales bacterium]|nr:NAD(P)-dependent oxidoreductase [Victivallales bacterium]HPO90395.1 NAD(P)-dependent oxidoreductase [Victivallales bacterium]HRR28067.1 NAD(P)-dependent oxidoreductase [Victivallales bacterium]